MPANCFEVSATNWAVVSVLTCKDVIAATSPVVSAASEVVTRFAMFVSDPISPAPIAMALAVPIAAT